MKKSFIVIITLLLMVSLSSCFSNTSKVTNNSINNKVINVEDYTINDVQDAIVTASEKAEASVVAIIENSLTSSSLGSAVVVKRTAYNGTDIVDDNSSNITHYEYYAITNEHVINGIVNFQYRVFLGDQIGNKDYQTTNITVIEKNSELDLAIIRFTSPVYIAYATVKNSTDLKKGQIVIAVGTPMDLDFFNSISQGVISHPYRYTQVDEIHGYFIQHDATINPGNSGGGLFNLEGKLVGINTWKLNGDNEYVTGMGFAIPSSVIYTHYSEYIQSYK